MVYLYPSLSFARLLDANTSRCNLPPSLPLSFKRPTWYCSSPPSSSTQRDHFLSRATRMHERCMAAVTLSGIESEVPSSRKHQIRDAVTPVLSRIECFHHRWCGRRGLQLGSWVVGRKEGREFANERTGGQKRERVRVYLPLLFKAYSIAGLELRLRKSEPCLLAWTSE